MKGNKNVSRREKPDKQSRANLFSNFLAGLMRQGKRLVSEVYAARSIRELGRIWADIDAFGLKVDMCARAFEAAKRAAKTGECIPD
jgi:hypothetical protein